MSRDDNDRSGSKQRAVDPNYVNDLEAQNQQLYNRLMEADDIIHELTKLVDISRNKQLQKKLLTFADASLAMINENQTMLARGAGQAMNDSRDIAAGSRQAPNIRINKGKKKK